MKKKHLLAFIVIATVQSGTTYGRDIILETTSETMTVREKGILWIKSTINTLQIGVYNGVITASTDGTPLPKQVEMFTGNDGKTLGSGFWSDVAWRVLDSSKLPTQRDDQDMKEGLAMLVELGKKKDITVLDILSYKETQAMVSAHQINNIRCKEIAFTQGKQ